MVREAGFRQGRRRARSVIKCQRSAGPSLKAQVIHRLQAQGTSYPQGSGTGHKLSTGLRHKLGLKLVPGHRAGGPASAQAVGHKRKDRGSWKKYWESLIVGGGYNPGVCRVLDMECNLVW